MSCWAAVAIHVQHDRGNYLLEVLPFNMLNVVLRMFESQ